MLVTANPPKIRPGAGAGFSAFDSVSGSGCSTFVSPIAKIVLHMYCN